MEVNIYKLDGSIQEKVKLPEVFNTPYRPRIINRAVLAADSAKIQPKGADPSAGRKTTAVYIGRRSDPQALINKGVARKPRAKNRKRLLEGNVRGIPGSVGGPKAHAIHAEEIQKEEINKKERILALKSALGVLKDVEMVKKRGHKFDSKLSLPVVVINDIESLSKTKDILKFMKTIGIDSDVERAKERKTVRAGKGKARGRKYKRAKSVLFIVSKEKLPISKAARNLEGVNIVALKNLSARDIAPGGHAGRLTVFSKDALEKIVERVR